MIKWKKMEDKHIVYELTQLIHVDKDNSGTIYQRTVCTLQNAGCCFSCVYFFVWPFLIKSRRRGSPQSSNVHGRAVTIVAILTNVC